LGVAEVSLGRSKRAPVGSLGQPAGFDLGRLLVDLQQSLDRLFGLLVGAFAEVREGNTTVTIDEVDGRPVVVVERPPDVEVVVDHDRVADA